MSYNKLMIFPHLSYHRLILRISVRITLINKIKKVSIWNLENQQKLRRKSIHSHINQQTNKIKLP